MLFLPDCGCPVFQRDSHGKFGVRQRITVGITGNRLVGDPVARILRLQNC